MAPASTIRPSDDGRIISPVNVFVFNLLAGACLGYFRLGQTQKAWTALVLFLLLLFPTWCIGSLAIALVAAVDGYLQASQLEAGQSIGQWTFFNQSTASGRT